MLVDDLRDATLRLQHALGNADPSALSGSQATEVVELFCTAKRTCEAGMALFGRRVEETGAFSQTGHRSAPEWLGAVAGESASSAKGRLATAALAAEVPELAQAIKQGDLSADQARVIAGAAALTPAATPHLLETAATETMGALRDEALSIRHRALSARQAAARRAHVHARRDLRWAVEPGGGVRGSFLLDEAAWGRCVAALEPLAERRFAQGRDEGHFESRAAYRADALVELCTRAGSRSSSGTTAPPATVHLRVDVESLRRGRTAGDEVCEIEGVGPVPVDHARSLLGDCVFELLVRDGADVVNLTGYGRSIPQRLRTAVLRRDGHCRWDTCRETKGLQIHHWRLDCAQGEVARLATLVTLCQRHHDFCTYGGWRIEPDGDRYRAIPPRDPVPMQLIDRKRKLAVRKAHARC